MRWKHSWKERSPGWDRRTWRRASSWHWPLTGSPLLQCSCPFPDRTLHGCTRETSSLQVSSLRNSRKDTKRRAFQRIPHEVLGKVNLLDCLLVSSLDTNWDWFERSFEISNLLIDYVHCYLNWHDTSALSNFPVLLHLFFSSDSRLSLVLSDINGGYSASPRVSFDIVRKESQISSVVDFQLVVPPIQVAPSRKFLGNKFHLFQQESPNLLQKILRLFRSTDELSDSPQRRIKLMQCETSTALYWQLL